jgi:hypothetical protein
MALDKEMQVAWRGQEVRCDNNLIVRLTALRSDGKISEAYLWVSMRVFPDRID